MRTDAARLARIVAVSVVVSFLPAIFFCKPRAEEHRGVLHVRARGGAVVAVGVSMVATTFRPTRPTS